MVTALLARLQDGDSSAGEELYRLLYADLRGRAGVLVASNPDGTLQATELVNEAWLKLREPAARGPGGERWDGRAHFLAVAAKAMRSVLIDHARARKTDKRGGTVERVVLDETLAVYEGRAIDIIALNDALDELGEMSERLARIVELRFFGGLSSKETAAVLEVSTATVERGWASARAWLHVHLTS